MNSIKMNLLVEEWGGKYQKPGNFGQKGSQHRQTARQDPAQKPTAGPESQSRPGSVRLTIIETSLDKGRSYVATLLVETEPWRKATSW